MEWKADALEHAMRDAPREACGLVVLSKGRERYFPCKNLAEEQAQFVLDPEDYARAEDEGDITAVFHSHPNMPAKASQADLVSCETSGLPWFIVSTPAGVWERIEPSGYKAPLVGRQFVYGAVDCYSLIRDWYEQERGITILDFERPHKWWEKGLDLYMDNFEKAGFVQIDEKDIQPGDLLFMQIRSKVVNHAGVYLGNNQFLHHASTRLSCKDVYGGYYKKCTRLVVRYKGTP